MEVRILEPVDRGVLDRVAPDVFDHGIEPALCRQFLSDPRHHLAVAIDGGVVVGMASAIDYVHPDKPVELWINEVGVARSYRRRGVGRQLLEAVFELGRRLGCKEVWVLSDQDNEAARGLYAATGGRSESVVMYSFEI